MKKVKLQYGIDEHEVTVAAGTTIGAILKNTSNKVILGYGDNVKALVNGVEQSDDSQVGDGTTIVIETRANSKALPVATK